MDALTLDVAPGNASLQWPRHILTQTSHSTQQMDALTLDIAPGKDSAGHFPRSCISAVAAPQPDPKTIHSSKHGHTIKCTTEDALTLDVAPGKGSGGHLLPEVHLCSGPGAGLFQPASLLLLLAQLSSLQPLHRRKLCRLHLQQCRALLGARMSIQGLL